MRIEMSLDKAQLIVRELVAARKQWGKHASVNYTMHEVLDALVVLNDAGRFDAPSAAEVSTLRRQLAACQNREKARNNKNVDTDVVPIV